MAYIVVWTVKHHDEWTNRDEYEDHYVVFGDEGAAQRAFRLLLEEESVWSVAITKVVDATEPHWMDDVTDDPSVEQEN